jgi:hypothetical protein
MRKIILGIIATLFAFRSNAQPYINYASGKLVKTTTEKKKLHVLTDGNLSTGSVRITPSGKEYTIEMDLTAEFKIGGIHLYFEVMNILPAKGLIVQYKRDGIWVSIDESEIKNSFSEKLSITFNKSISTSAIRILTRDVMTFGILEWQVWGEDVPTIPFQVEIKETEPFIAVKHWVCVNQAAYNIDAPKGFTVPTAKTDVPFSILEEKSRKVVYSGTLKNGKGDFTDFNPVNSKDKEYVIQVQGGNIEAGESFPFRIGKHTLQKMAYQSAVDFFNDARSIMGSHPSSYGGTAWRDGTYYTFEVPSMVMLYLSDPKAIDNLAITMDWDSEKGKALSPDFKHIPDRGDDDPMYEVTTYYGKFPELKNKNTPDLIQSLRYGVGWNLAQPISRDISGDPLGKRMHGQTIEQFAYFLYGYPAYKKYIGEEFYEMVLDSTVKWWNKTGLLDVITKVGFSKGRHASGHSIMPNLLMYEVAKRENLDNPGKYLKAAQNQAQWMIDNVNWDNPSFSKGQRISEHKTIVGLSHFQYNYPELAPKGLKRKIIEWAEKAVSLSNNMWDFRMFDENNYTLPGYNEAGNVIGFPACALSVALVLDNGELKNRIVELAYSHYDNFNGRNPQNASAMNYPEVGFEGIDSAWPFPDLRKDVCARLEHTRGSLSSLPGSEMYPFNPNGKPRHGEGWTVYNSCWNLSIAYLNFYEKVSNPKIMKNNK